MAKGSQQDSASSPTSEPWRIVRIDPPDQESRKLWSKLLELAQAFGKDEGWALVGGLMVQLHAYENDATSRPTEDIDILGDSRKKALRRLAELLEDLGEMARPPATDEKLGYQWNVEGQLVELLAPDGLKADAQTIGKHETISIDGGTQALRRTEIVLVAVGDGEPVPVRRPTLLGAILIKARALQKVKKKEREHREDLIRLLTFVEDPRSMRGNLEGGERRWLRRVEKKLAFDSPEGLFSAMELGLARRTFELLTG